MTTTVEQASAQFRNTANRLPTLFEIEDEAYRLMTMLERAEFEPDLDARELENMLALYDQMLAEKTESYVSVIRSLEAMSAARKVEADRLKERAALAQKQADWLRNRLLVHMQTTARPRIETARFTLSIRQNPQSVLVLDAAAVPHEFERTKISIEVDKRAILERVKQTGEVIPGVEIIRTESLRIA